MTKLKRELSLFNVTIAGIGLILGAGIYALIGVASGLSVNSTWLSFLISAFIALFTGLSYAELSSMFKGNSGEYDYVSTALNKKIGFLIGLSVILAAVITVSAVSLGFGGYLSLLIPIPLIFGTTLLIFLMTVINFLGIKQSNWFNSISTFIEFSGLILIIVIGFFYFGKTPINYLEMPSGLSGLFSSAALVFFAYLGFESIIKLREETINPEKNIPLAILLSIVITSIVYVLVAISAISVVGWEALSKSNAPMSLVASTALGSFAGPLLAVIALFSTANTVLISMVTAARQVYGMAKEKSLPNFLSSVNNKTRTPWFAIFLVAGLGLLFSLFGNIEIVANITNVFLFITFAAVNLSLLILRYKQEKVKRPFKCPLNIGRFNLIAFFGLITSLAMLFFILFNFIYP